MSWITGVGLTPYGRHPGKDTLDLMAEAATLALADAGLGRADIDGVITGYSTTLPHLMLSTVFCEHFGLDPHYAHGVQIGGATGLAMAMLAHAVVEAGMVRNVLVVAGENRLTGAGRDSAVQTLAQVGHPVYEVPLGPTIPAYYALIASHYLAETGAGEADLAALAVLMRRNAASHPGAQFRAPIAVADVLASRPIATPLKLLDCCPVSDGAAAFVVGRDPAATPRIRVRGCGQAHRFQHISAAPSLTDFGAAASLRRAGAQAGLTAADAGYLAIYDSFTITLAVLLEELGISGRGEAGAEARAGRFDRLGEKPLNTHGGLLSYGHCGAGGAIAHLVEAVLQLGGRAGERQARAAEIALLHGDGGVLSSHVTMFLERVA